MLSALLQSACSPQLSFLSSQLPPLLRLDIISAVPHELAWRILLYLDATSLCRASQVCKLWNQLAEDDVLWHHMCEQHIEKKCTKCGWILPLMYRGPMVQRPAEDCRGPPSSSTSSASRSGNASVDSGNAASEATKQPRRRWKDIYAERLVVERNWRRLKCECRQLGSGERVTSMFLLNDHLVTGSADGVVQLLHMKTGNLVKLLLGHTGGITAVQMDHAKIISGSLDGTARIWSIATGECIRTIQHSSPIVHLHFEGTILALANTANEIRVIDCSTKSCESLSIAPTHDLKKIHVWGPDHIFILTATLAQLWNWRNKMCIRKLSCDAEYKDMVIASPFNPAYEPFLKPLDSNPDAGRSLCKDAPVVLLSTENSVFRWRFLDRKQADPMCSNEDVTAMYANAYRVMFGNRSGQLKREALNNHGEPSSTWFRPNVANRHISKMAFNDTQLVVHYLEPNEMFVFDFSQRSSS